MRLEIDLTDEEALWFDTALQGMIASADATIAAVGHHDIGQTIVRVARRIRDALGCQDLSPEEMGLAIAATDAIAADRHNKRKGDS